MNAQKHQPAAKRGYGYADGGIVGGIRRIFSKTPPPAQPPAQAPAAAPAPAPAAAISDYAGMTAMQRREKEAGLANGGLIKGPGTGTSDSIHREMEEGTFIMPTDSTNAVGLDATRPGKSVPVRVSNGELALTPEKIQAVGVAALTALKDLTHTPTGGGGTPVPEAGPAEETPAFADGGLVEEERRKALVGQIPTGGAFRAPPAQPGSVLTDTELGRNVTNTLSAVAPGAVGGATRVLAGLGRVGSAAAASPAAAAVAPFVPPVAGGAALAAAAAPPSTAPAPVVPTAPAPAALPSVNVTGRAPMADQIPPTGLNSQPALGVIRRDGNSYSGTNIGAGATIDNPRNAGASVTSMPATAVTAGTPSQDAALAAARSAAADRGDFGAIRSSYAAQGQSFGAPAAQLDDARLEQLAISPLGTPGRSYARQQLALRTGDATTRRGQDQVNAVATARLGIDRAAAEATQAERQGLIAARNAYINAKTPEEKAAAETTLRAMQGKYEKEVPDLFSTTPLPGGVDEMGNKLPGGAIVTDRRTGATKIITGAETQGKPAAPAVGTVKSGYRFKGGNPSDQKNWEKV